MQERPGGEGRFAPRRTENRERSAPVGDKEIAEQRNQASKPLNFQASNCPCTPGTSATCQLARRNNKGDAAGDAGDTGDSVNYIFWGREK